MLMNQTEKLLYKLQIRIKATYHQQEILHLMPLLDPLANKNQYFNKQHFQLLKVYSKDTMELFSHTGKQVLEKHLQCRG